MFGDAEGPEDGRALCLEEQAADALMASPQEAQQRRRKLLLAAKASTIILAAVGLAVFAGRGVTEGVDRLTSDLSSGEPVPDEDTVDVPAVADDAVQLNLLPLHLNARRRRKSWHTKDLGLCKGDCNWQLQQIGEKYTSRDNCPGELKCFRWGVPPGCKGKTYPGVGWCYEDHHTVLMIVSKKRSRTDLEILFSHDKLPRSVDMIAFSRKPLSFHLWKALTVERSAERSALTSEGRRRVASYKHVVIQEYTRIPVFTSDRRRHAGYLWKKSMKTVKKLDKMIRSRGGRTVLFQTWANIDRWEQEMPHIIENHKTYARMLTTDDYKPLIAPVGRAYDLFRKLRPDDFLKLWCKDKAHESELARYYTALVLYETIGGKSCIGLPGPVDMHLSDDDALVLQSLAHQAVVDTEREGFDKKDLPPDEELAPWNGDTGVVPAADSDGLVPLHLNARRRRKSWHTKDLGLCRGDCNWELHKVDYKYTVRDNCPGELKCFRWGVPPGCKGKTYPGVGWCYQDQQTVLMIVSKMASRTDLEILFSHDKLPRSVDMIAASKKPLSFHLWKALEVEMSAERVALTSEGRRRVGSYKHVVLQEYIRTPVYTSDRRRHAGYLWKKSMETIKKLDEMIRLRGGRTVIFQTWANIDRWEDEMPHIIENHKTYAQMLTTEDYKPLIAPVGHAYDLFRKLRPDDFLKLWEPNRVHESEMARYYTALVLYETIGGKSCVGLPGPVDTHLSDDDTRVLQGLAHQAVVDTEKDGWR